VKRRAFRICNVLFVLFSPFVIWRLLLWNNVNSQLRAIRAEGLPANVRELNAWYEEVPENRNAALVLTKAFTLGPRYPDPKSNLAWSFKLPAAGRVLSKEEAAALSGFVQTNSAMLEKADEALRLPDSRYPIDLSMGANTPLPHLAWLKEIATIKQFEALLAIQRGKPEEASLKVQAILDLARTLDREPILISQFVRLRLVKTATKTLEFRINAGALEPAEITNLLASFERVAALSNQVTRALIGERALYATFFRPGKDKDRIFEPAKDEEQANSFPRKHAFILDLAGFYDLDFGFFLFSMRNAIAHSGDEPPDNLKVCNYLNRAGNEAKKRHRILSGNALQPFAWSVVRDAEGKASLCLAMTSLAIERFRNQQGRLPESIDEIIPDFLEELPEDPFTGLDLKYERRDKGYLLYSVGPDRMDDHGLEESEKKNSADGKSDDLPFHVMR
jgi:hypothetical protein